MQLIRYLSADWKKLLRSEMRKDYFKALQESLEVEMMHYRIFPGKNEIFKAFEHTSPHQVKVVVLGQDPYHGDGQANGLAFSVNRDISLPPSLKNIFKERKADLDMELPRHGDLSHWAAQGVLLLNTGLTVRRGAPGSHKALGWQRFTDYVIEKIAEFPQGIVFLLWGNHARSKKALLASSGHYILEAAHPSPFSANRGFLGCRHFSKTNNLLEKAGREPVDWSV